MSLNAAIIVSPLTCQNCGALWVGHGTVCHQQPPRCPKCWQVSYGGVCPRCLNDASRTLQHGSDAPVAKRECHPRKEGTAIVARHGFNCTSVFIPVFILCAALCSAQDLTLSGQLTARSFSDLTIRGQFSLGDSVRFTGCTIDGEDSPGNQIQVDGNGVTFDGCKFLRCPGSAIRLHGKASNCRIVNCTFEGSQALNTQDKWTGTGVIFANNIVRVPAGVEGLLIDQPGVGAIDPETGKATGKQTTYSGVVIANNTFECEENAKRGIGLARCVSVIVTGNTFRGAKGVEDLLHFEDRASKLLVTGNLFDLAGALHGIDGSNGGDEAYHQKDRVPRNCVFTGNALWCQQGTGIHLQGTDQLGPFVRMTITGNTIHDAAVGVDAYLEKSTLSGNTYYGVKTHERIR